MSAPARVQVLLPPDNAERFNVYCRRRGFIKSTLIARLVREYLDREDSGSKRYLLAHAEEPGKAG